MRYSLVLPLLLLPFVAAAEDNDGNETSLTVKPSLCIVDRRTPSCDMRFLINWQTSEAGYYCVNSDPGGAALRCWEEAQSGEHRDAREVSETFRYWLNRGDDQPELASATVEVLRKDGDDRRRRRRTKHVWDLL